MPEHTWHQHVCANRQMHACTHTHIHTHLESSRLCTQTDARTRTDIWSHHVCAYRHMHTHTHTHAHLLGAGAGQGDVATKGRGPLGQVQASSHPTLREPCACHTRAHCTASRAYTVGVTYAAGLARHRPHSLQASCRARAGATRACTVPVQVHCTSTGALYQCRCTVPVQVFAHALRMQASQAAGLARHRPHTLQAPCRLRSTCGGPMQTGSLGQRSRLILMHQ